MTTTDPAPTDPAMACLQQALAQQAQALEGYPVAALVEAWPAEGARRAELLQCVLQRWRHHLDGDLDQLPSSGTPVLQAARCRMQETREALSQLLVLVQALGQQHAPPEPARRAEATASAAASRFVPPWAATGHAPRPSTH